MRDAGRMVAALRAALFTRLDLLCEILALRHQQGVLARSDRRFRPTDRLLWLCLQRFWPRWRDALVLVQPGTVDRWRRAGFWGCWRRRSRRRPGRPRIDSELQALIRRMRADNFLWGAPRIHGELLKLGITVSERTVSRYLPNRLTPPSQTWRTFFANHFGIQTSGSAVTFDATGGEVINADVSPFRSAPSSVARNVHVQSPSIFDGSPALESALSGCQASQAHVHPTTRTGFSSGRDPPLLLRAFATRRQRGLGAFLVRYCISPTADEQPDTIRLPSGNSPIARSSCVGSRCQL